MCPTSNSRRQDRKTEGRVVCFGMITPARVLVVDQMPDWNTGAVWTESAEFVSDDAAIIAGLLAEMGTEAELIGSALGDDDAGHKTVAMLKEMGVKGKFRIDQEIVTPFEVNVSDSSGGRTYFWNRQPDLLATLDDADLSPLQDASMLYVDWYDSPHIERALRYAQQMDVPVYLNIEHGHQDPAVLKSLGPYAAVCQAVTDASQMGGDAERVAKLIADCGVPTVLVTLASKGAVGMEDGALVHIEAPALNVVDTCGAGATFSAGFINSRLNGLGLEGSLRFAVAAASLKCSVVGLKAFPRAEVNKVARALSVTPLS